MRSALAYRPRPGPLGDAGAPAAIVYLSSFAVVAFAFSNPLLLAGAGAGVAVAGAAAGAGQALRLSARLGLALGVAIVAVNALVNHRGDTVLVRGFDLPVVSPLDVTLESIVEGGVLALRVLVVVTAFAVYSASVDPDRVLRLLRPVARRSALTATLIARAVPLAAADHARLREAAALRGPGAAAAGRAAVARRLVEGSLDRAVDVAATLELRGYALQAPVAASAPRRRSRHDGRLLAAGLAIAAGALVGRAAGLAGFEAFPSIEIAADPATLALAAFAPLIAPLPFARARYRPRAPKVAHA
jgi:energy-coupling factor transport system permease protein